MLWDIFCRVIDNHGDLGVCWRLSADLAARGHSVRLWVDNPSALSWMAPEVDLKADGHAFLQLKEGQVVVQPWLHPIPPQTLMSEVWIEAFGCELPEHFLAWAANFEASQNLQHLKHPKPSVVWLNLEYLSAESYVERSHKLPSPVMSGPLKGQTKWFFYPGFTDKTGGLIRELDLEEKRSKAATPKAEPKILQKTTLFCYEPTALTEALLLKSFNVDGHQWQVAHGRGAAAFDQAWAQAALKRPPGKQPPAFCKIAPLTQGAFDQLLATSDLNFVRGEDSLVRALWAGQAFVWQIYPQDDGAHAPKLNAFLDWLNAPDTLRQFHLVWNGLSHEKLPEIDLPAWQACALSAQARLQGQIDLVSQLLQFVSEKR